MKKIVLSITLLFAILSNKSFSQESETLKRGEITLKIILKDVAFDKTIKAKLITVFFEVYPKLMKDFNPDASSEVTFTIDPTFDGVAATEHNVITFGQKYLYTNPKDVDVATHELMHVVQDYKESVGPGWLTEGIADYARDMYGLENKEAGWSLGRYSIAQNYRNGYQVTARFLKWIDEKRSPGFVKVINTKLRNHEYKAEDWNKLTGLSLTDLWIAYALSPDL